jgi:hypothetical protein
MKKENEIITSENEIVLTGNTGIESILPMAIEKGDVAILERTYSLYKEMKADRAKDLFFRSLADFQSECPAINKSNDVTINGSVRYKFASLPDIVDGVKKLLKKYGFSYVIKTKQESDRVTAICESHHEAGHTESTEFSIPVDSGKNMSNAQYTASALTYAKRYAFLNAYGIMTADTDDDGQQTVEHKPQQTQKPIAKPVDDIDYTISPKGRPLVMMTDDELMSFHNYNKCPIGYRNEINKILTVRGYTYDAKSNSFMKHKTEITPADDTDILTDDGTDPFSITDDKTKLFQ